jgi:hypothetical protein
MYHDAESAQELEPGYENSLLTGPGRRILSPTGSRWEHHGEKVVFGLWYLVNRWLTQGIQTFLRIHAHNQTFSRTSISLKEKFVYKDLWEYY